ncbi:hypothetical protein PIB30_086300 [Stylosanthes scabra]|uniref:Uncharacterized protein n=1 Tax=Stylosanthes scabra TaxID=79078 RepID=A0ABU6QUJ6_9FABA|nr:hypothetical protein [Stylosanthes scabra]
MEHGNPRRLFKNDWHLRMRGLVSQRWRPPCVVQIRVGRSRVSPSLILLGIQQFMVRVGLDRSRARLPVGVTPLPTGFLCFVIWGEAHVARFAYEG